MRKLTALCLCWAVGLSLAASFDSDAEDIAVTAVFRFGGTIVRDDKAPRKPIVAAALARSEVTDAGLKEVAAVEGLRELNLWDCTKLTDAGLEGWAGLKALEKLDQSHSKITDRGLKELVAVKTVRELYAFGCEGATDAGMKE